MTSSELTDALVKALNDWMESREERGLTVSHHHAPGFNAGWRACSDYCKAEQQRTKSDANAMIALLASANRVRGGAWMRGAPTHVLAELLTDLEEHGWRLVNEGQLEAMVQKPPRGTVDH